jgi:iron complex outermembrane receptor protein
MKKVFFLYMLIGLSATGYQLAASPDAASSRKKDAYEVSPDSLNHIQLEELVVSSTRAGSKTPVSYWI